MFTDLERQIYACPSTGRKYDPLALKRELVRAAKGQYNAAVVESRDADELKAAEGQAKLVRFARAAFGLAPIDPATGEGVLDATALDALTHFTRWLRGKDERAGGGPPAAPCSGCP